MPAARVRRRRKRAPKTPAERIRWSALAENRESFQMRGVDPRNKYKNLVWSYSGPSPEGEVQDGRIVSVAIETKHLGRMGSQF